MVGKAWHLLLVIALLAAVALAAPGCDYSGDGTTAASDEEEPHRHDENIEEPPTPKKGNPKLGSHLWDLISANERGEAEEHAQLREDIDLVDGGVRVIIECVPGQVESAAAAASEAGAKVELTTRSNLVQAVVPITSLNALAEAGSIRFIRLPHLAVPQVND